MIALVVIALAACIVVAVIQERRVNDARFERDALAAELEALRLLARAHFIVKPQASPAELLRLLDMHRPVGVSLRVVVHELACHLEHGDYPQ